MITNQLLIDGVIDAPNLFPHLDRLRRAPFVFKIDFGLSSLPEESGMLMIRGARQYGKSTWLEQQIYETIKSYGPGTAFYLNGEDIADALSLENSINELIPMFSSHAPVKRIFIDEITAVKTWEKALKKLADKGLLGDILIVTTGSQATDLRRGFEKLPGRKGKLKRSAYLFTPLSYKEFHRVCHKSLGKDTLLAYLLSGGSPIACSELAKNHTIPNYVIELVRDWIEGEIARANRHRSALLNIMHTLYKFGGTPTGQAKLARESGLANNTVAASYIELLNDLGCVTPAYPWDHNRKIRILRKPCKYHFTNVLSAVAYYPAPIRSVKEFQSLPEKEQGMWYEWLIAQELQRRAAITGKDILEPLAFWQTKSHEIDFVSSEEVYIEVKRGKESPLNFAWFNKHLPHKQLLVLNEKSFKTQHTIGMTIEDFLLGN